MVADTKSQIYCRICYKLFRVISVKHLKRHSISMSEYRSKGYPVVSDLRRENTSKATALAYVNMSDETKQKIIRNSHTQAARQKRSRNCKSWWNALSEKDRADFLLKTINNPLMMKRRKTGHKKGEPCPWMCGEKNIMHRPEVNQKVRDNNGMKRKEVQIKVYKSLRSPVNHQEKYVFSLIDKVLPGLYEINTNGQIIKIGNMKPDFVCIQQMKVIEYFGSQWHKPEEEIQRMKVLSEFGYGCLIIWDRELDDLDSLNQKLRRFHGNKNYN